MPKILFVCVENSCRSQMAEAFARRYGAETVEAYSAGSSPSGEVNAKAVASMRERGYDLSAHRSKSLDDLPKDGFDCVVTMGCGDVCPQIAARVRQDWSIPDPKDMAPDEFARVRDEIENRVRALLREIG